MTYKIIEIIVVGSGVIVLFWGGIFVGRECGSLEKFVLTIFKGKNNDKT